MPKLAPGERLNPNSVNTPNPPLITVAATPNHTRNPRRGRRWIIVRSKVSRRELRPDPHEPNVAVSV